LIKTLLPQKQPSIKQEKRDLVLMKRKAVALTLSLALLFSLGAMTLQTGFCLSSDLHVYNDTAVYDIGGRGVNVTITLDPPENKANYSTLAFTLKVAGDYFVSRKTLDFYLIYGVILDYDRARAIDTLWINWGNTRNTTHVEEQWSLFYHSYDAVLSKSGDTYYGSAVFPELSEGSHNLTVWVRAEQDQVTTYIPLWAAFFGKLQLRVVLSDKSNSKLIHRGLQEVLAETCYPVKVAYGHMVNLIEKGVDSIFLPCVIDLEKDTDDVNRSYNCPYIQAIPFVLRAAFETRAKIISPTIFMAKEKRNLEAQMMEIGREFGKEKKDIASAIAAALEAQEEFDRMRLRRGKEILEGLREDNEAVAGIGKPYNVHDTGLNLNVSKKLRKLGMIAIPFDMLPLDSAGLPSQYSNLVWKNEQNLLRAAMIAKDNKRLNPIMITNYGCGPDAFFAKYLEDTMEEDPYLVIEVDEHSGDAGMVTRLEAFLDTLDRPKVDAQQRRREDLNVVRPFGGISIFKPSRRIKELEKTLHMSYVSGHSDIWAAAFQAAGIDARVLPEPDELSEELGRKYVSSKECHPYLITTGDMVKKVWSEDFDPDRSAFVMLNFDGSCRLSQYALSQKLVLKRLGLGHVPIIAPITSIRHDEATRLFGLKWAMDVWKGWLATDVLLKKLLYIRPYEINEGESERVYQKAIEEIASGIVKGNFSDALEKSMAAMEAVPVKRENRPIIGIVGEFYSCMNSWANNDIIKELESLGAEVRYGPSTTDYLVYFNEVYPGIHFSRGERLASLYYYLRRFWFMGWRRKIERMLDEEIYDDCRAPKVAERIEAAAPYVTDAIDPVVTVNVSKAENYASSGCSGIANLIVLNCLYGTLNTAIYKKVQREHDRIPVLTIIYEGLKPTNEQTRIEAFMHQAKLYHDRHCIA